VFNEKFLTIETNLTSIENILAIIQWLQAQLYKDIPVTIITPSRRIILNNKWKQLAVLQILKEIVEGSII